MMKRLLAKMTALSALLLALSLPAAAAEEPVVYGIDQTKGELTLTEDGTVRSRWEIDPEKLTITQNATDGLVLQFRDPDNGWHRVALGDREAVLLTGSYQTLVLAEKVEDEVRFVLDEDATVRSLQVQAPVKMLVNGGVSTLQVTNGRARVTVGEDSDISKIQTTYAPAIVGAKFADVEVVDPPREPSSSSSGSSGASSDDRTDRWSDEDDDWRGMIRVPYISCDWDDDTLRFDCNVSGAAITWNGHYLGRTDAGSNFFHLPVRRTNSLTLEKSGYGTLRLTVYGD